MLIVINLGNTRGSFKMKILDMLSFNFLRDKKALNPLDKKLGTVGRDAD